MENVKYPTEYILGKPRGSISTRETHFIAKINDNKGKQITKSFSYTKKTYDEMYKLVQTWLCQKSNEYGLTRNALRFLDENTIEIKSSNDMTFTCNITSLKKIQKYPIILKAKKEKNKIKYFASYEDKKQSFQLTSILTNYKNIKFKDKNTLNLCLSNLEEGNIKERFKNIPNISTYFKIFEKKGTLPMYKYILGKPTGTIINHKKENKLISRVYDKTKKEYSARFDKTDQKNATEWKINVSHFLGVTENLMRINKNFIEVKLNDNKIMITDRLFLRFIQNNHIVLIKSHDVEFCVIRINSKFIPLHKFITGYDTVMHINGNRFDNRLINLYNRKDTSSVNNVKKSNEDYTVEKRIGENIISKSFSKKKYGDSAEKLANTFNGIITSINFEDHNTTTLYDFDAETLQVIKKFYEIIKAKLYKDIDKLKNDIKNKPDNTLFSYYTDFKKEKMDKYYIIINNYKIMSIMNKILQINYILNSDVKAKKKIKLFKNDFSLTTEEVYNNLIKINRFEKNEKVHRQEISDDESDEDIDEDDPNQFFKQINKHFDFTQPAKKIIQQYYDFINTHIPDITTNNVLDQNRIPYYYQKICNTVKLKKGIMLSPESDYETAYSKLHIKCKYKHEFEITLNNLNHNQWCPVCSASKMEQLTKFLIEYIFDKDFRKVRPKWLERLEIDIYNDELKFGVEYNGKQHYEFVKYWQKSEEKFEKQKQNDAKKLKLCKENKIKLLVVPYHVKENELYDYLIEKLYDMKINFTEPDVPPKLGKFIPGSKQTMLLTIVKNKKGKLIKGTYITKESEITIKCDKGHIWTTRATNITHKDAWCHECGKEKGKTNSDNQNKSDTLKEFYESETGKKNKKKAHEKRSETMQKIKDEVRATITEQKCAGYCGATKPITEFAKRSTGTAGYQSYCRECINQKKREWRAKQKF
jgi:hypothetical protein